MDKLSEEIKLMYEKHAFGMENVIVFSNIVLLDANEKRLGLQNSVVKENEILK